MSIGMFIPRPGNLLNLELEGVDDKLRKCVLNLVSKMDEIWTNRGPPCASTQTFTPLESLNRAAAASVYTRLSSATGMRLLKVHPGTADMPIQCSVFEVLDKSSAPPYTALSYTCKPQELPSITSN